MEMIDNMKLVVYAAPVVETVMLDSEGLVCISGSGDNWNWSILNNREEWR